MEVEGELRGEARDVLGRAVEVDGPSSAASPEALEPDSGDTGAGPGVDLGERGLRVACDGDEFRLRRANSAPKDVRSDSSLDDVNMLVRDELSISLKNCCRPSEALLPGRGELLEDEKGLGKSLVDRSLRSPGR